MAALERALSRVRQLPPLVHSREVDSLQSMLADACVGKAFVLQGGDCAERFLDCNQKAIENKFKILLQMSLVIIWYSGLPVIKMARMAGQFAKPRSSSHETLPDGSKVYSFKGDNVNGFDPSDRIPDPERLVSAYFHSAATLNFLRGMISGGVADLHSAGEWKLDNVLSQETRQEYEQIVGHLLDGIKFLHAINADQTDAFKSISLFTGHEGLLLPYEEALTSKIADKYYNLGSHFLWIGDRTREVNGAHIEYFRGITNPIGLKCGPSMNVENLRELLPILNPNKVPGHLSIITRYGASKVRNLLPAHIRAVKQSGIPVVWICDPCHGNGIVTENGVKTRNFKDISTEISETFAVHEEEGSILGGVHLELTGEDVTECIGGSEELESEHLSRKYETFCDPRLNYTQSLDIAILISKLLKKHK
uniref:Phospho-2-dehydro-3-deoxyheptonate aldolase n=1 Tax=Arcella intermedia TaxID=1963864 RepID=A0A6B2L423_9EUKA